MLERPVIERIFARLGLDPQPPPTGRAHEPGLHVAARVARVVGRLSLPAAATLPPPAALYAASANHGQHSGQHRDPTHPASRERSSTCRRASRELPEARTCAQRPTGLAYVNPLRARPGAFSGPFSGRPIGLDALVPAEDARACCPTNYVSGVQKPFGFERQKNASV